MPVTRPPISPLLHRHNKALIVWGRNERERGEESCTLLTLQWFDPLHLLLLHCTPISLLGLLLKRDKRKGWIKDRPEITTHSIHNSALSARTHTHRHTRTRTHTSLLTSPGTFIVHIYLQRYHFKSEEAINTWLKK